MRNDCSSLLTSLPKYKERGYCYLKQSCHVNSWLRPCQAIHWRQRHWFIVLICGNKYLWFGQIPHGSSTKDWIRVRCSDNPSLDFLVSCICSLCSVVFHNLSAKGFPNLHVKMNSFVTGYTFLGQMHALSGLFSKRNSCFVAVTIGKLSGIIAL